jgi:indolepyruvate decarboxylase
VRLNLKPIIFLLNNDGYTIERLIFGPQSSYNDISPWDYRRIPAALDKRKKAAAHRVRTDAELESALHAARDASRLHLIELVLSRMDAPESFAPFAKRAAVFDFPQIVEGGGY